MVYLYQICADRCVCDMPHF